MISNVSSENLITQFEIGKEETGKKILRTKHLNTSACGTNKLSNYLASRLFVLQTICQLKCRNTKFSSQNYYMMEYGTISFPIALLNLHLKNKEIQ
jgi:hypothetical protein